ncbi:hypothetical protein KAW18_02550 [candidate division WOR-3 bacterium]|nr:hypothetical protein [candidate division WOR-3 bacterium]
MNNYLNELNKITKSDMIAVLTVFIGLIGLIVVFSGLKIVGNIVIWFACAVLFVVCYMDKTKKNNEK